MRVRSVLEVDVAVEALQHVARYDSMRLETYRQKENLADRICISPIDSALALRFDDVGYFNRVYCADQAFLERLPEIESFYRGGSFGCELVAPPSDESGSFRISRPGWAPVHHYVWLHHPNCTALWSIQATPFDIRPPKAAERQQFLLAYLRAFEAQEDRIPAALRNMRHLFDRPELDFLMAWHGGTLAGVAILMRCGSTALLCAGAALPEFREMGCHAALLAARIRLASEAGCRQIYSWAELGGQSHANMERIGLEAVGTTTTWRYSAEND
ncbi:MAG: family acetyltransferase [Edaphobacter sp.]|nr:family acetyltransferase [Edaphobacter sp.]